MDFDIIEKLSNESIENIFEDMSSQDTYISTIYCSYCCKNGNCGYCFNEFGTFCNSTYCSGAYIIYRTSQCPDCTNGCW